MRLDGGARGRLRARTGSGARLACLHVAANEGARADGDARRPYVADDTSPLFQKPRLFPGQVTFYRSADDEPAGPDVCADESLGFDRHLAVDGHVPVDAPVNLEGNRTGHATGDVCPPPNPRDVCHGRSSRVVGGVLDGVEMGGHTSMSTLPLNWAPSAIVMRVAFTLPTTRAPACRST